MAMVDTVNQNIIYSLILYFFSLQKSKMISSVSNEVIEWCLDFGPDSVTLTVRDLVQAIMIVSQEVPVASWRFFLSQKQEVLNNHLVRVTPHQQGTHEMWDEVFSSVGAQDMETSGYQVSDLHDLEVYWGIDQPDVHALLILCIDTTFPPTPFEDLGMGGSAGNPILLDKEDDKENSPSTTPVFEKPTRPHAWLRSCQFTTRKENAPDYGNRKLFQ